MFLSVTDLIQLSTDKFAKVNNGYKRLKYSRFL